MSLYAYNCVGVIIHVQTSCLPVMHMCMGMSVYNCDPHFMKSQSPVTNNVAGGD